MKRIQVGDRVRHINYPQAKYLKVSKLLPKGSHGKKCQLVEVLNAGSPDFTSGLVKVFRLIDLRLIINPSKITEETK